MQCTALKGMITLGWSSCHTCERWRLSSPTALYCTALHCTALYCTARHCTVMNFPAMNCIALPCTTLYCTALHYTVVHCTTHVTIPINQLLALPKKPLQLLGQRRPLFYNLRPRKDSLATQLYSRVQYSLQYSTVYITVQTTEQ